MVQDNHNWSGFGGDAGAAEEHAYLWGIARRLTSNPADADDLAQEVWVEALEHPPECFHHFRGWAAVVARRAAGRGRQRERARRERERRVARDECGPSTLERCERADSRGCVAGVLDGLASPYREVVSLRYVQELSIGEICRRLDRPAGTVRCQLKRGLERVRDRLGSTGLRGAELLV